MKKNLTLIFLAFLLSACQSLSSTEISMPDWWVSPPEDSTKWLYGLGEGPNLNIANQQALSNIAGKLQTRISASLSRRTQETTVSSSDYINRQLSSEIEKVSLSHFETIKTETLSGRVMALVRVDKEALASDWSRQIQVIENDLVTILSDRQSSRFQWWIDARSFVPRAAEGDKLASLIAGMIGVDKNVNFSQQLSDAISKNKPSAIIAGDQAIINRVITTELLSQELRIGGCKKCDLIIQYDIKFSSKILFGESIVKMDFSGTLIDNSGYISSNHWSVSASSVSGLEVGKNATLSMAEQKIKGEGLWKAFGMETK